MALAIFLLWILFFWLAKRMVFRYLKSCASRSRFVWGDVFVTSLESPASWLILASALAVFANLLPFSGAADRVIAVGFKGAVIFSVVLFADNLVQSFIKRAVSTGRAHGAISSGVIQGLLRGFLIGLGVLIFLQLIGISITPILASLGIGSLAVALALQDTLSNFFAGIYISMDKPVQTGDFIRLESGDEGCVTDIGWRSTRIRTGAHNVVILPNAKLIGSVVTNYNLPNRELAVSVEFTVAHEADLERIEKAVREAAASLRGKALGLAKGAEPVFHFQAFTDAGIRGTVVLRAREFFETGAVKHELIKAIHERLKKEGVAFPAVLSNQVLKR